MLRLRERETIRWHRNDRDKGVVDKREIEGIVREKREVEGVEEGG